MIELSEYRASDLEAVMRLWWDSWHGSASGLAHPLPFDAWRARWLEEILAESRRRNVDPPRQWSARDRLSLAAER